MLDFLQRGLARPETFGQVIIDRRVLVTPRSTISIPHIAFVSSGTLTVPSTLAWNLALALLAGGLVLAGIGLAQKSIVFAGAGGLALVAGFVLARFFAKAEVPCLSVSSSDGHTVHFVGQRHTLEEARRLLSEKINSDDENAIYRISFEKGAIQAINVGHPHPEPVAAPHAPAMANLPPMPGPGSGRMGLDSFMPGAAPPAPHLGNGHYPPPETTAHIDYSQLLPQIVDMQRFYAQRRDTQDIADQLGELERLMRSGTPTAGSRNRVGQLTAELSAVLGAYPAVVQVFQQAARLAGFP
jgi:hypothetical protein